MAYTEIKEKNKQKYYYRVKNERKDEKFKKKRIYLGKNLDKQELKENEEKADKELNLLKTLLTKDEIEILEKVKENFAKEPKENLDNRYESFISFFTYDSNAIEGNSFTLEETSFLLFEKRVPKSKSLREINETLNHKKAFDYMLEHKQDITKDFICRLHQIITQNTLKEEILNQVGKYRTSQVFIKGRTWIPPKPSKVPNEMRNLLVWYSKNKKKLHPIILSTYFHIAFETIHPFIDGNGRVGRLLMNFILHKHKYPMINIPNKKKFDYYEALNKATIEGNLRQFIELMISLIKESKIKF